MRAMQTCGVQVLESVDHPEVTQSSSEEDPFVCNHPLTSGVSLGPVSLGRQLISFFSIPCLDSLTSLPVLRKATSVLLKARDESPLATYSRCFVHV